jgi:RNA:NAD 2'-phosphotransferase (TPT1/KptA family)
MRFSEIVSESTQPAMLMSADKEEIPSVLYHGTSLSTYEHIKTTGLRPMPLPDERKPYVFLAWSDTTAYKFAPGGPYSTSKEPGVILEVTITPEIAKKIRSKLGEFLRCPVEIPASMIRVIDHTNT